MPRPTAQVAPYVEALGPDLALSLILHFGGADLYIPEKPTNASELVAVIGFDGVQKLQAVRDRLQYRVPVANRWAARIMAWQGLSNAAIARRLRVTTTSVRLWLNNTDKELCRKGRFTDD
jgi:hypothetical protein